HRARAAGQVAAVLRARPPRPARWAQARQAVACALPRGDESRVWVLPCSQGPPSGAVAVAKVAPRLRPHSWAHVNMAEPRPLPRVDESSSTASICSRLVPPRDRPGISVSWKVPHSLSWASRIIARNLFCSALISSNDVEYESLFDVYLII